MAYTINANAKNVWIRDNEDTRDLSIQTDASSVYLDNGRTLEQELGEGSMVSNVATVDTSMSKVIDGTLDGAYESCVFKGKSLVNLLNHSSLHTSYYSSDENGTITVKNTDGRAWSTMSTNTFYFKANTTYTFIVYDRKNILRIDIDATKSSTEDRFLYTTKSDVGDTYLRIKIMREDTTIEGSCKLVILEGDYLEEEIPYFTGICDVKMPILRNIGKNLFDVNLLKGLSSNVVVTDGIVTINNAYSNGLGVNGKKAFWFLKPNKTYRYSCTVTNTGQSNGLDGGFYFAKRLADGTMTYFSIYPNRTFTIPSDWDNYTISIMYGALNNNGLVTVKNMQFEEANVTTAYEDHKTNILRTSEEIVLRSLPNGVCDTYNARTGEYVKRIGERTLNGSEAWIANSGADKRFEDVWVFHNQESLCNGTVRLCDKLQARENANENAEFIRGGGAYIFVYISKNKVQNHNANDFKTWLQSNPITVQYELAEPITTIVEPLTIPFAYQNGHIILESGFEGQSLLPTLEYSTVVNRTGQVESVAKTIQTQEKQLTMLEQMLIQNIIGLDYNNTVLALNLEINEVM